MSITMLRKVDNPTALQVSCMDHLLMMAYTTVNPVEAKEKNKCRFMLFVRLRPGVPSFTDRSRTGYYPGNKYTDKEPEMLRNLLKMLDKRLSQYDRIELYDNEKVGDEKIILKITDDCINRNDLRLYLIMLSNYILPKWLL